MPNPISRSEPPRGFTLVEVLAVLVVFAVLAAAVLVSQTRSNATVVTETEQLAAHLRYTQMRALGDVDRWSLTFTGANTYRISRVGDAPVRVPGSSGNLRSFTGNVEITLPSAEIRFDTWGRPVDSSNVPLISDVVLILSDGSNQATVTIAAETGFIR